ncbi:MAG: RNA polymerase sigma factor [Deltaproteobacteria bacterium]|nr:RNA polymerase sigma factor [Deltaproteobacteria bacterium]
MDPQHEQQLVARAIQGDRRAVERLWQLHRRWVAAVVLAHKPAEAEVDDLLQEVVLGLLDHIHELRDPTRLRSWLRVLARNTAVSSGRRATTRRRFLRALGPADVSRPDPAAFDEERMAVREATRRTLEATEILTPDQRECLLLRAVKGMSQKKIAALLDIPETTVETRLARARRRLRAALTDEIPRPALAGRGR